MSLTRKQQNEKLRELVERFLPQQEGFMAAVRDLLGGWENLGGMSSPSRFGGLSSRELDLTYPRIFLAIEDGVMRGPMTELDVRGLPFSKYNLVFDATQNDIVARHRDERDGRHIQPSRQILSHVRSVSRTERLGSHSRMGPPKGPTGSILELLRVLVEHPRIRQTHMTLWRHTGWKWEKETVVKCIKRLRVLLGDNRSKCPFILTDENLSPSVSKTRTGYYLDPQGCYLMIRYPFEVSLESPSDRPVQVHGT